MKRPMSAALAATAALTALLALTALPADADSLGSAGDVRYKRSTSTIAGDSVNATSAEVTTYCDKGWRPVGGGITVGGSEPRGIASTSLGGQRYWYSEVWHQTATAAKATGHAMCLKTDKLTTGTSSQFDLPDTGGQVTDVATCAEGNAVSGGMRAIGDATLFRLNASYPVDDDSDVDAKPDNGWQVYTQYSGTDSGADAALIDVVCLGGPAPVYRTADKAAPAHGRTTVRASCPKHRSVISGGIYIDGAAALSWVVSTRPWDGGDADKVPDDGWTATSFNDADFDLAMTAYAVCR
jgi:hypothetical protein